MLIRRIDAQAPFGADHVIRRHIRRAKAATERGKPLIRKTYHHAGRFYHFSQALLIVIRGKCEDFGGIGAKYLAGGVEAINADVVQVPTTDMLSKQTLSSSRTCIVKIKLNKRGSPIFPDCTTSIADSGFFECSRYAIS